MKMNQTTYEKARNFMYRNARPLDLARFQYHFENGSKEAVLNVLSYYQNEDGGFGHAVEADCWNPNSSPIQSNTASEILREIGFEDASHPVIQGLLKYYGSGKDFDGKHWAVTVASNNDYPHAHWWHTDSASTCHADYNGTAQIAGFIVRYADRESELFAFGLRVVNEAIEAFLAEELNDKHTCACYVRMLEYVEKAGLTDLIKYDLLKAGLHEAIKRFIVADKSKWGAYICKPSDFFNMKSSEYYEENREIAEYECEFILNTQLEDGSWDIPWTWKDFPNEWAISKNWWKGNNIVLNLLYLKGFGKL